jgi:hypothetical protein
MGYPFYFVRPKWLDGPIGSECFFCTNLSVWCTLLPSSVQFNGKGLRHRPSSSSSSAVVCSGETSPVVLVVPAGMQRAFCFFATCCDSHIKCETCAKKKGHADNCATSDNTSHSMSLDIRDVRDCHVIVS